MSSENGQTHNKLSTSWSTLVAEKQKQCQQKIPESWRLSPEHLSIFTRPGIDLIAADACRKSGIMSELELQITEKYTATELVQGMATREISALDTTTAFCKRAAIAQQLTSCLTETLFPEALARARFLDEYIERTGQVIGPLHGLPVSVKDSFNIKGVQSTIGYVSFLEQPPASSNSALIDMLLDLGAVLYVKTNIPQTMMTGDSENNIFGRTLNPNNTAVTAGGSSGGEGALVAFRGSVLGVGTDVAGSIRIPALCCGVYGFKPTVDRIPFGGQTSGAIVGLPGLIPSAGPLAHNLEDIKLFTQITLNSEPWKYDVTAINVPWRQSVVPNQTKLTIGVPPEDSSFPLHPPVRRVLETAIEALERHGHKIIRLPIDESRSISFGNRIAFQYFTYGPHEDNISPSGEPLVTSVAKFSSPMFTGPFLVNPDADLADKITGLHNARENFADAWRKTWVDHRLDVVLAPGSQSTAVPHDTYGWPPYTLIWNLLDYPACIIPFGKASKHLDPTPMKVEDDVQPSYDPETVDGLPCAIQIITPKFQDEKCLIAAEIIDRDIRK